MNEKVLISGAAGFIGRHLIKELKKQGIDYLGIDNTEDAVNNIIRTSLLDFMGLKDVLKEYKPTVIVHLAAIALATYENTAEIYNVNVVGTENLMRAITETCTEGTRMVMVSTAGVYGNQNKEFYDETLPFNPENHYSYSKMITEYLSAQYGNIDIRIVRPFNIIGAGQRNVFLIPKLIECFAQRKPELRIGNIKPERDYVSIEYCIQALLALALKKEIKYKVYNICSGIGHSVQDVIDILKSYYGYCPEIIVDEKFVRKNEIWRMVGNPERLLELLDGKKSKPFDDLIIDMCEESQF